MKRNKRLVVSLNDFIMNSSIIDIEMALLNKAIKEGYIEPKIKLGEITTSIKQNKMFIYYEIIFEGRKE